MGCVQPEANATVFGVCGCASRGGGILIGLLQLINCLAGWDEQTFLLLLVQHRERSSPQVSVA